MLNAGAPGMTTRADGPPLWGCSEYTVSIISSKPRNIHIRDGKLDSEYV